MKILNNHQSQLIKINILYIILHKKMILDYISMKLLKLEFIIIH